MDTATRSGSAVPAPDSELLSALDRLHTARFSCRAFLPDSVPHDTILRILEVAQLTATWCNTQPWKVYVTEREGTERFRMGLYGYAASGAESQPDIPWPSEYQGIYLQRRRDAGFKLHNAVGIQRGDTKGRKRQLLENYRLFGAPHMMLVTTEKSLGPYAYLGCGSYVANFLLGARALGVDTCAQAAIAHHSAYVREHFQLTDEQLVVCGVSFGYADLQHPANQFRLGRAAVADVVNWVQS